MEKKLGKITSVCFGLGGYQDACIGLNVNFQGEGWGVGFNKTAWDKNLIECTDRCKWSEVDRSEANDDIVRYVSDLLSDAKVSSVDKLKGIPVEVSFEGNTLKSWRVLTEVL